MEAKVGTTLYASNIFTVADFVKLMLTNSALSNSVEDLTWTNEPPTITNTLYLCESTNGTAEMTIQGWWQPVGVHSNWLRYEIMQTNDAPTVQWTPPSGIFATNSISVTWTNTASGETNREFIVRGWFDCNMNGGYDADEPHRMLYVTVLKVEKIPLGGSADLNVFAIGKIYIPTKWGGILTLAGANVQLFFTDGSDLDPGKAVIIFHGGLSSNLVASGNPCTYVVPQNSFRWYYVSTAALTNTTVTNVFVQSNTVAKAPWTCPDYPWAEEGTSVHLYDTNEALSLYDLAYATVSLGREKRCRVGPFSPSDQGHYVAKQTLSEQDCELTTGYDVNTNGVLDAGVWGDFWHVSSNNFGQDGLATMTNLDASWWGHCDQATAAIICEDEPTNDYCVPGTGIVFNPDLKKGILVALYHDFAANTNLTFGPDPAPYLWHRVMEDRILGNDKMFGSDGENSGTGNDLVMNTAIYELTSASYQETPGSNNERLVRVDCNVNYWYPTHTSGTSRQYRYDVLYGATNGIAVDCSLTNWICPTGNWSAAFADRPDSVWVPYVQTNISSFWGGQLNYSTVRTIVPEPGP